MCVERIVCQSFISQFLKELNRAIVTIVPCGFTSVFESLASGAPLIFLPDNHNGHVYEYLIISESVRENQRQIFPNLLFTLDESNLKNIRDIKDSMKIINNYTNKYFKNNSFRDKNKQVFREIINNFNQTSGLMDQQRAAIKGFVPFFNGSELIADKVLIFLKNNE